MASQARTSKPKPLQGVTKKKGGPVRKLVMTPGERFGRLVFLADEPGYRNRHARFRCDCGAESVAAVAGVFSGKTSSCGCLLRDVIKRPRKHGAASGNKASRPREYGVWCAMRSRCLNPKNRNYNRYGERGITICQRWLDSFENFYADMGPRPTAAHTIEREDNDGPYSPENCRWATRREQALNTSRNRYITIDGTTRSADEWAALSGIRKERILQRLLEGADPRSAVFRPMREQRRRAPHAGAR